MNKYIKPLIIVEALYADVTIAANDNSALGEIDPTKEISIPIGGNWEDLLGGD